MPQISHFSCAFKPVSVHVASFDETGTKLWDIVISVYSEPESVTGFSQITIFSELDFTVTPVLVSLYDTQISALSAPSCVTSAFSANINDVSAYLLSTLISYQEASPAIIVRASYTVTSEEFTIRGAPPAVLAWSRVTFSIFAVVFVVAFSALAISRAFLVFAVEITVAFLNVTSFASILATLLLP